MTPPLQPQRAHHTQQANSLDRWSEIETWVFDLDNTLYAPDTDVFVQMEARMEAFVSEALQVGADEARRLRQTYYREHGATLNGLMREHGVAPHAFLDFVHDLDLSQINPCSLLRARIAALPGRKLVFTNGTRSHAERVTLARGLEGVFDGMFDIAAADFTPKPQKGAYERFLESHDVDPGRAAMFEDMPRNLQVPHALGFVTVLVGPDAPQLHPDTAASDVEHIHHHTEDLTDFLNGVHDSLAQPAPASSPRL